MDDNRNLSPTALKAGSPRSGCWHGWVLVRTFHVSDCQLLTVSSCSENRQRELTGPFAVVSGSLATPQTVAGQAPLSMRFLYAGLLQGSSRLTDQTCVSLQADSLPLSHREFFFLNKGINPFDGGSTFITSSTPKAPLINTILLGVRISTYEFGKT